MKLTCNCCDGVYNSLDVHFTSACDNKCRHCVDQQYEGTGVKLPAVDKIADTVINNSEGIDDVLFLGGEPCLYLEELSGCIEKIQMYTDLKIFVTTAIPQDLLYK